MRIVKRLLWFSVVAGVILGMFYAVSRSQDIIDWWKLRDYDPPLAIETLATNAGFNDEGRKLFYLHEPLLLDKNSFTEKCIVGEVTIVLGCYISHQSIYIFDVQDERLEGVEEVTAAHEMLHAAFDRLSPSRQEEVGQLLTTTFNGIDDERIRKTVQTYEERDPSVVVNELHSILGTEVRDLPGPLEEHYTRYFTDRSKVVELAEVYADEFERREAEIAAFDARLAELQSEIARKEAELTSQAGVLERDRRALEALGSDPQAYNAAVDVYNGKVRTYNTDLETVRSLVESYNVIVKERNAIALEERELVEAIDTRVEQL